MTTGRINQVATLSTRAEKIPVSGEENENRPGPSHTAPSPRARRSMKTIVVSDKPVGPSVANETKAGRIRETPQTDHLPHEKGACIKAQRPFLRLYSRIGGHDLGLDPPTTTGSPK